MGILIWPSFIRIGKMTCITVVWFSHGLKKQKTCFWLIFSPEFYGIDMWMLKKALSQLEAKGKAQMFEAPDATDESGLGVKFFS